MTDENRDLHLGEKLEADASAWLTWMVRGCLGWQGPHGLQEPEVVTAATNAYRGRMDTFHEFVDWLYEREHELQQEKEQAEENELPAPKSVPVNYECARLHETYQHQADINGWVKLSAAKFQKHMLRYHFEQTIRYPRHWKFPEYHGPDTLGALAAWAAEIRVPKAAA